MPAPDPRGYSPFSELQFGWMRRHALRLEEGPSDGEKWGGDGHGVVFIHPPSLAQKSGISRRCEGPGWAKVTPCERSKFEIHVAPFHFGPEIGRARGWGRGRIRWVVRPAVA